VLFGETQTSQLATRSASEGRKLRKSRTRTRQGPPPGEVKPRDTRKDQPRLALTAGVLPFKTVHLVSSEKSGCAGRSVEDDVEMRHSCAAPARTPTAQDQQRRQRRGKRAQPTTARR